MRASRQSNRSLPSRRAAAHRRGGFTLIELIFVLALLAITASLVSGSMASFFRNRTLSFEARRMLSLSHYGQSRAVAEGVPVVLWVNPQNSTYGLTVQASYNDESGDLHAVTYVADPTLTLETPTVASGDTSEQDDEKLGLAEGVSAIRFTPDGFIDQASVAKITIRQGNGNGLELVPTANRLAYEIQPATDAN